VVKYDITHLVSHVWGEAGGGMTHRLDLTEPIYLPLPRRLAVLAFHFHISSVCSCKLGARGESEAGRGTSTSRAITQAAQCS